MSVHSPLGILPDNWSIEKLECLATKIGSGATPRGGASTYLDRRVNHALVRSQCVHDRSFDLQALSFISDAQAEGLRGVELQEGDVLLNITGDGVTFGRCCQVPAGALPAVVNQHVAIIRPKREKLDPGYLASYLVHPDIKDYVEGFNAGGSRRAITKGHIESFEIALPPIEVQREIAAILGALDDKIELNRKTAATLEEMARVLYRSWFITFDPVHAKAAGRAPAHMDTQTADLFPDSFGEDGLPEGWDMVPLKNHVSVLRGLSYKGAGLCEKDEGIPLHNLNSVFEGGGYKTSGIKYYRGDFKPRHEIIPGDLIVTNTEQGFDLLLMGHSALVPHHFGPIGLFSQHIYKVEPKSGSPLSREWLYLMLSVSPKGQEIRAYSNGTTVNMLPIDALEIPEVCTPPHEVIEAFDNAVKPMLARQESLEVENQTLATLRDTLLPRLMSGELRVGEAKEQVEEVV